GAGGERVRIVYAGLDRVVVVAQRWIAGRPRQLVDVAAGQLVLVCRAGVCEVGGADVVPDVEAGAGVLRRDDRISADVAAGAGCGLWWVSAVVRSGAWAGCWRRQCERAG